MLGMGLFAAIGSGAKKLFSGEAKAARLERKATRQAAKAKLKEAKEAAKQAIQGGGEAGAKAALAVNKVKEFFVKNWMYVLAGLVALVAVWYFFIRKKTGGTARRRGVFTKGASSTKARMAKVRAARRK